MKVLLTPLLLLTSLLLSGQNCVKSLPYTENFDNSSWVSNTGFSNSGSIPNCWTRTATTGDYLWMSGPTFYSNNNSGPNNDHTTGNGKFAVATPLFSADNRVATQLITPPIDLSTANTARVVFYYHMFGNAITKLDVRIRKVGNNGWTVLGSINYNAADFVDGDAPWKRSLMNIPSSFIGDTVEIRFTAVRPSSFSWFSNSEVAIDDLVVQETPSCDDPVNVSASAVASSTATLNWTSSNSSPIAYQVRYKASSTTTVGGTITTSTSKPVNLSGLSPNTTYAFQVRDICSVGDTSAWSLLETFLTSCSEVTAPWTEDFDGSSFVPSSVWNQQGTIDQCWGEQGSQYKFWTPAPLAFTWNQTGPTVDHTTGTSSGQWMAATVVTTFGSGLDPRLFSPWIDLDTLSQPQLSFWYHAFGSQMGDMTVRVRTKQLGWTAVWDTSGALQNSQSALWKQKIIDLSDYVGDTIRIWFEYTGATGNISHWALDDIAVEPRPSCPQPQNLSVVATGVMAAQFSWSSGGASHYQLRYREAGTTTWLYTSGLQSNKSLGGLSPATTYEWQLRDSCGTADVSQWVAGVPFTTQCMVIDAPYTENFSGSQWSIPQWPNQTGSINDCWDRSDSTDYWFTTGSSSFSHYFGTGPSGDHTTGSGKYIFARSGTPFTAVAETSIRLPLISLDTLQTPMLTFWHHLYGADIDKLEVYARTLGENNSTRIKLITNTLSSSSSNWVKATASLKNFENDTVVIRFVAYRSGSGFSSYQAAIAIDDISIDETTVCPQPSAQVTVYAYDSVNVAWNGLSNYSTVEVVEAGNPQGSGTVYSGVQSPFLLSNLQPNTNYVVYVQDSCTSSLQSTADSVVFATPICPPITASGTATLTGATVSGNSTTAAADSTIWYWGDGATSNGASASHTYTTYGSFTVLQVDFSDCGSSDTVATALNYCAPLDLQASLSTSGLEVLIDTAGTVGTGLVLGGQYGDGNAVNVSALSSPHTYAAAGSYTVVLWATDQCGNSDTLVLPITVCAAVQPTFSYTANGNTFSFTAAPTGMSSYSWNFGDGGTAAGATANHTYASNGTYTVTLTVVNSCGEQYTYQDAVATCQQPTGDFTFAIVSTGAGGMVVNFQAAATNATSYTWNWGDGQQSVGTSPNAQHTYAVVSLLYTVKLTLQNECGDNYSITRSLKELGISELDSYGIALFPNPASERVQLTFAREFTGTASAYDLTGQQVYESTFERTLGEAIDVTHWPAGTYLLQLSNESGFYYQRLVIE